jgi:hypothetical protein
LAKRGNRATALGSGIVLKVAALVICAGYFLLGANCLRLYGRFPAGYPDDEKLLPLGLMLVLTQGFVGWVLISSLL